MCGIVGQYQWGNKSILLSELERATQQQHEHEPDSIGLYPLDGLQFDHSHFKIFDLIQNAAQPIVDHALGLTLIFNGAIYNFIELRKSLQEKGYNFFSDSDAEVLLKAYHAWGQECIPQLRGMFVFAIWEHDTGKLILVRDRMGIKPLYYAQTQTNFKFASTLPALLMFRDIDTSIDKIALHYYLTFHAVPDPRTILNGVKKLPPASVLIIHADGKMEEYRYWQMQQNEAYVNQSLSENEWLEVTQNSLLNATKRQLATDVPVGILLSGRLDSSLLVAFSSFVKNQEVKTFSIGFECMGREQDDAFKYSDQVAQHFGTTHHKIFIKNQQLINSLSECIAAMSEPVISHDNIGFYLLSHEIAKHVKVVLSGQGADELFAGYHRFQKLPPEKMHPSSLAHTLLSTIAECDFYECDSMLMHEYRVSNHAELFLRELCEKNASPYAVDNMLVYESSFALTNGPLCRRDNVKMASSIEVRAPFLDEEIVDVATMMPMQFKLQDNGKYILKKIGRKILPKDIVDRPKGYFPVPALKQIQSHLLTLMREILSPKRIRERGIFNEQVIQALLSSPTHHFTPLGVSKLWQIGLLEYWLELQGI